MTSLNKPVLVLNKVWMPIRVIPSIRAFKLLFAHKASAVNTKTYYAYEWEEWLKQPILKDEVVVHSVNYAIKIPEVIVLSKYDKVFRKNAKLTKRNIYIRDGYKCQYSGKKLKQADADIDHIIPKSQGGKNSWDNMVVCTREINRKKGNKTPEQAGLKLIKKPIKPDSNILLINPKIKIPLSWNKFIKGHQ